MVLRGEKMRRLETVAGTSAVLFVISFYVGLTALLACGTFWICRVILFG
jgi:hypothetical protein